MIYDCTVISCNTSQIVVGDEGLHEETTLQVAVLNMCLLIVSGATGSVYENTSF